MTLPAISSDFHCLPAAVIARDLMWLRWCRLTTFREKILLIEGIHDLVCSKDDIEELWQSWGKPDIWRLPCGHVRICCGGMPGLPGRVLRWLALRFDKLPSRNQMPPHNPKGSFERSA